MTVYLSLGKAPDGQFHHISEQPSGRSNLSCPFCGCPLIAVKGRQRAAHFRHDGETCNESLNEIPLIPGWHQFHLSYPLTVVAALQDGYDASGKSPEIFQHWKSRLGDIPRACRGELLKQDSWTENLLFTDTARVILGSLPLMRFSAWMRGQLQARIRDLQLAVSTGTSHRAWFEIEAQRQQAILSAKLYLFEYRLDDGQTLYKVGRTRRDPADRLPETIADLEKATGFRVQSSAVVRIVECCGHVEKYVFHRYGQHLANIGQLTEYLVLDGPALKRLKSEFTRLANVLEPFDKAERFIVTGRWQYEEKRLAAARRGIAANRQAQRQFGRPAGTTLSCDALLAKHADIVAALQQGASVNEATARTGKSRSTVKRVKQKLLMS